MAINLFGPLSTRYQPAINPLSTRPFVLTPVSISTYNFRVDEKVDRVKNKKYGGNKKKINSQGSIFPHQPAISSPPDLTPAGVRS